MKRPARGKAATPALTHKLRPGMLTLADFEALPRGAVVRLHYNTYNRGTFLWRHSHVADDRVHGSFWYPGDSDGWSDTSDYMYEFIGFVCRGSGAEPVCGKMPKESCFSI